jgi:uncharacterized protein YjiS (DUF1127 family)
MTTRTFFSPQFSSSDIVVVRPKRDWWLLRHLLDTLREWRRRASARRELATLSALDLKDIGHPAEAEAEKAKPFWRA